MKDRAVKKFIIVTYLRTNIECCLHNWNQRRIHCRCRRVTE